MARESSRRRFELSRAACFRRGCWYRIARAGATLSIVAACTMDRRRHHAGQELSTWPEGSASKVPIAVRITATLLS
jgi:hypothetical protein